MSQRLSSAIGRVERNKKFHESKSALLSWTFKLLAGATILVMGDLVVLGVRAAGPAQGT
jgi:hypothetical protein